MLERIKNEPALVNGLVLAVLGVLSAFGLGLTDGQTAGIVALVGAVLALLGAGVTRSQVTPVVRRGKHAEAGHADASLFVGIACLVLLVVVIVKVL